MGLTRRRFGEIDYDGHITKCVTGSCAPIYLKQKVLEPLRTMEFAESLGLSIAKSSMKKACVAVARKLAVLMHKMWVENTNFKYKTEDLATVCKEFPKRKSPTGRGLKMTA